MEKHLLSARKTDGILSISSRKNEPLNYFIIPEKIKKSPLRIGPHGAFMTICGFL